MKDVVRGLVPVLLVAATGVIVPSPASAHTEVCVGQGVVWTPPMYLPAFGPNATGSFTMYLLPGWDTLLCLPTLGALSAAGPLSGSCGLFIGTGTMNGHAFSHVSAGSVWILFSQPLATPLGPGDAALVVGVANVIPWVGAASAQSCTTGATQFLVTGAVAMVLP